MGDVIVFPRKLERRTPDATDDEMTLFAGMIAKGWTEDAAAEMLVVRRRIMGCDVG